MFALGQQVNMLRAYSEALVAGLRSVGCGARASISEATLSCVVEEVEALMAQAADSEFPMEAGSERLDVSEPNQSEILGEEFMRRVLDLPNLVAQAVEALAQATNEMSKMILRERRKLKGLQGDEKTEKVDEVEDGNSMVWLAKHYALEALDSHQASFEQACAPLVNQLIAARLCALAARMNAR